MSFKQEAKRVKFGQSLIDFENQAIDALSRVAGIKSNLEAMKNKVKADKDFAVEDEAEISDVISNITSKIKELSK